MYEAIEIGCATSSPCHVHELGDLIYLHAMRGGIAHAMMSHAHHMAHAHR